MTKILTIEDETTLREEIIDWLTFEGYEVTGAADGIEGVNAAVINPPDLIVCDISMPRMDGYGVLLALQANTALQSIPFIFLSAKTDHEDIRKGMQLGADDYMTKPFHRLELLKAIRARLMKKAEHDLEREQQLDMFKEALASEHERRLLQAKLVAMFSHDFRNQLTVIMASASLVRDYADQLTANRRVERLNAIEGAAQLLMAMLDDMLSLAQMETGNYALKPEALNIAQFFNGIVQEFQMVPGEKHRLHFKSRFTASTMSDSRLLRQIAANLISNAIKYSPLETEIIIALEQQQNKFVLSVKDHGIGIPDSDLEHLLDSFYRGSNVGNIGGTGLGLAVVKQALDLLGGAITVESQMGVGTTIHVTVPYLAITE
jgi:signal transduction histidine kinase